MPVVAPFIFWLVLFFCFLRILKNGARESFVWSTIVWGALMLLITESLSLFKAITPFWLGLLWSLAVVVAGAILIKLPRKTKDNPRKKSFLLRLDPFNKTLLFTIIGVLFLTAAVAIIAPPNTYDSMTYHMSRVMHWAQNRSVAHYPTVILRQLAMTPAAEFAILNFQVLLGNDYLANFGQWFCLLGSLILITLIAKLLGANTSEQIFSAFIGATLPMGILQATGTQTDLVTAFWLLGFAFFVLKLRAQGSIGDLLGASLTLGLALLTKPTAYFIAAPFVLWLIVIYIKRKKWGFWKPLFLVFMIALVINSGYYVRNAQLFNSLMGPNYDTVNETFALRNITSNILKFFSLQVNSPFPAVNELIYNGMINLHTFLKVDINDERTSFGSGSFKVEKYTPHEGALGNPVHLFLALFCCAVYLLNTKNIRRQEISQYLWAVIGSFFVFFMFISYQPWLSRLTMGIFGLFAPFVGIVLSRILSKRMSIIVCLMALLVAVPPLLMNVSRPLIPPPFARTPKFSILLAPRQSFYFCGMPETYRAYQEIVRVIKERGYKNIGIKNINNEYPLWVMLQSGGIRFRLEHVEADNVSERIPMAFDPDVIICFRPSGADMLRYRNKYAYVKDIGKDSFDWRIILFGR